MTMQKPLLTVREVAQYLRLNPRSVYLLAQRGAIPATRVTGKWLFPRHLLDEWLEASARGKSPADARGSRLPRGDVLRVAGSDDPALGALPGLCFRDERSPLLYQATVGSLPGLTALGEGRADLAWAHLLDPETGEYNRPQAARILGARPAVLVNLFVRELGLVVWAGNPRKLRDLEGLTRPGLRFVNRQRGSGTRHFLDASLARAGIPPEAIRGYRDEVSTHWAVGLRVLRAEADAGLAVGPVARALSLGFVPLARERFDLVVPQDRFFSRPVQALLEAVRSPDFHRVLDRLGGYDTTDTGRILAEVP